MRGQHVFMGLALLATTALGACGTVANGGTQTVDVVVKGSPTAYCTFTTSKFRNSASFPNKLTLERSKENLHADCQGEQNRKVVFDVPARMTKNGSLGNVVYGVLPGMAYDSATGALWEYPNPLIVDFRAIGEGAQVEWPDNKADADLNATTRGTAPIVTPQPLRMQPVLDEDLNPAAPAIKAPAPVSMVPMKANAEPEVIDAATLALKNKGSASSAVRMTPVASPEDKMGADPAKVKAQAAAKAKAAEDAKRKAAEKAAAKKKADAEAKAAAAEAAAKAEATTAPAQMLPETTTAAPGETPTATTTTTTTTVVTPAPAADVVMPAPAATQSSTTTTTTTTAPAAEAPKDDMDKYLDGGQ